MTNRLAFLLATSALCAGAPALARQDSQPAPQPQPPAAAPGAAAAVDNTATEDDEGTIVVTGQKPRGSVVGDIPPENVLTSRDIRATGATSISELLDAVSAQTGSARGRSSGRPILLLNGQRISGFRELRDLPPEAIERMEILPEEVALKYGYSADNRVVNIVLRRRFNSTSLEAGGSLATDGGYAAAKADGTSLVIADGKRTSLNLHLDGNNPLYESERSIAFDSASGPDPRAYRTLVGAGQSARLTGTLNRTIGKDISATVTSELDHTHNRSRFGIDPFAVSDPLTRSSTTDSAGLGIALNTQRGKWYLSSTGNAQIDRTTGDSDRTLPTALTGDSSRSNRRSFDLDATASGPLLALPAGHATATFRVGVSRLDLDGRAHRADVDTFTNLGRTIGEGSVSLDLPVTKRGSPIGRLSANVNGGVQQLSDFGTLTSLGAGLNWVPATRLNLTGSMTREEGAPTLQALGDPIISTANVPFFDAVSGTSVTVTAITGGNPALNADRRTVWKLGGNWQPSEKLDLRLRADFVHEAIDQPQIAFPAATAALEAAFPDRFVRDGSGRLVSVDFRPVNGLHSRRDTLRVGFDFTKPLKSTPPSAATIAALRTRFAAAQVGSAAGGAASPAGGAAGRPDGDGGGRGFGRLGGGGPGGGRSGGRLTFSLTDTVTLTDRLTIASDLPDLDYLHGEANGANGGQPRHLVEAQAGWANNGLGVRLGADWRSATRVDGGASGDSLRFGDYATLDLRLFANLGERLDLVAAHPFMRGSSLRLDVKNVFNARPDVRGGDGSIPFAYQPDRLEPVGRTVGISFRKLFLPSRFARFGGGAGGGAGRSRGGD